MSKLVMMCAAMCVATVFANEVANAIPMDHEVKHPPMMSLRLRGPHTASNCMGNAGDDFNVNRIFRAPRYSRGNTGVMRIQPIDDAAWIWKKGDDGRTAITFLKFKCEFDVCANDESLEFDVSGDERFYLTIDGKFVARGPHRGTVSNWQYQSYRTGKLSAGKHTMEAVVCVLGGTGPVAQLSHRGGFVLRAYGAFDERLTTGKAKWKVGKLEGVRSLGGAMRLGIYGVGDGFEVVGRGPWGIDAAEYGDAVVVRRPITATPQNSHAIRSEGWALFPSQLPDQIADCLIPGKVRAAAESVPFCANHVFGAGETNGTHVAQFNELLKNGKPVTIPAGTHLQLAWDLGRYICAYPELEFSGAKGARVAWCWAESAFVEKNGRKEKRNEIVGKKIDGICDVFVSDGKPGSFSAPWFRCGMWCRIDIDSGESELTISRIGMTETRYPLEDESVFASPQVEKADGIRNICLRTMQMCAHEMLFDCPYYEQQMYPGDTRVQLNVLRALTRDDRLIRRAIDIFDLSTRDDGMAPMNFPTRFEQESFSYTLCYLLMYGDYVMNNDNVKWLRARLPGMRKSLAGAEYYENEEGLIANPPGWIFMDWVPDWVQGWNRGTAPGTFEGDGITSEVNLFWVLAIESAERVERALGNEFQARYWHEKAERLKAKIVEKFWDDGRGMLADNAKKNSFSEHAQALAIVGDVLPAGKRDVAFGHLITERNLARTTVYFSYYLFEAYCKMGRGDLFLKRLDLWRDNLALGLTTVLERPEDAAQKSRSDCHAWGAHPIWFLQTGIAGIQSAAPFFAKVRVAPSPGDLREIHAKHPHPKGFVTVDLKFDGGKVSGTISTPVEGVFEYGNIRRELNVGKNDL